MQNYNLHTHSNFSDGKSEMEEMVLDAISKNLKVIGITDHSPMPFENRVSLKKERINDYVAEVKRLKDKYKSQINVRIGMEMEYIPGMSEDFQSVRENLGLEYLIGSVHLVEKDGALWFIDGAKIEPYDEGLNEIFHGDIKAGVKRFFEQSNMMIENEKFEIIGHFDKIKMNNKGRYFQESDKWYRDLLFETLDLIKQKNLIVEVNTRGMYKGRYNGFYPSEWLFPFLKKMRIPVIISSDGHLAGEVSGCFEQADAALSGAGIETVRLEDLDGIIGW